MDTRSIIFVTIDKLVSPSSSVNGDPLDDFPDHRQPRFSAQFPPRWTSEGADWAAPSERKISPVLAARKNRAVKPCDLLSRSCHSRGKCLLSGGASIKRVTNDLGDPRFRWSRDQFVAQLFLRSYPVPIILSLLYNPFNAQLMLHTRQSLS